MSCASRRHWLRVGAGLAVAGWLPLDGCTHEPVTRHAGRAFGSPAELVLWGPDEDAAGTLASGVWKSLDDFDRAWTGGGSAAAAALAAALSGAPDMPPPPPGADSDIAWRGLGLDRAVATLRLPEGAGALLSLGQHLAAIGERGLRPWHVGIPDPADGHTLAGLDLYAGERLVTVSRQARYRASAGPGAAAQAPSPGQAACTSCSVLVRGGEAVHAARSASLLFAAARADWPALAATLHAAPVLWAGTDGRLEADLLMTKRALPGDARRPLSLRAAS